MKTLLDNYIPRIKQILFIAIFTTMMSQIRLDLYNESFIVSFGPLCIPLFIYLFDKVDIISTAVVSAGFIFVARLFIHFAQNGNLDNIGALYLPETGFYIITGVLYFIFDQLIRHNRKLYVYLPGIMLIDYISNNLDLYMRIQVNSANFTFQWVLISIAVVRGVILLILLVSLDKYRVMLFTKSHAQRYHRLIMLMSKLSEEVVWMNKNLEQIESTMSTAYGLYDALREEGDDERAKEALSVAKDIHEIKKEYRLIARGLSETSIRELEDGMEISALFTILLQSIQSDIGNSRKRLVVSFEMDDRIFVKDPYWFLSVFRNLISNSYEACETNLCAVQIREHIEDDQIVIMISDNGPGIKNEYVKHIFEPRFSTKIDYETGVVNRGLGLPIVKGIVEENLGGTVRLSPSNYGARFVISVPLDKVEVIS